MTPIFFIMDASGLRGRERQSALLKFRLGDALAAVCHDVTFFSRHL